MTGIELIFLILGIINLILLIISVNVSYEEEEYGMVIVGICLIIVLLIAITTILFPKLFFFIEKWLESSI